MIDGFAFVQSNKATDHSMAYADLDSSNRELKSLSSAIAMWISMFGQVKYLGVSTCPIPLKQARFILQPVTSSRDGISTFSIQPECPDVKNQQRLSALKYVFFLTSYQSFPNIAFVW